MLQDSNQDDKSSQRTEHKSDYHHIRCHSPMSMIVTDPDEENLGVQWY